MNNVDVRGFPGAESDNGEFDGGDTAAIVGNLIALGSAAKFNTSLPLQRSMLIKPDGLVRHPDTSKWYGQVDRFSRDQLLALLCSYVHEPVTADVRQIFRLHKKNWFLTAWNTKKNGEMYTPDKFPDITGPEVWALWARVLGGPWWLKCLLLFLDLETLVGSIIWRWFTPKTNRVCRNHMLVCIKGMEKYPTIAMRAAFYLNDWDDLVSRWEGHCTALKEYADINLFRRAVLRFYFKTSAL